MKQQIENVNMAGTFAVEGETLDGARVAAEAALLRICGRRHVQYKLYCDGMFTQRDLTGRVVFAAPQWTVTWTVVE